MNMHNPTTICMGKIIQLDSGKYLNTYTTTAIVIDKAKEGATSYGKNNYECAGVICTDGNQPAKGI